MSGRLRGLVGIKGPSQGLIGGYRVSGSHLVAGVRETWGCYWFYQGFGEAVKDQKGLAVAERDV